MFDMKSKNQVCFSFKNAILTLFSKFKMPVTRSIFVPRRKVKYRWNPENQGFHLESPENW